MTEQVVWLVEWADAYILDAGWADRADVLERATAARGIQRSAGWLVAMDDTSIVLALSQGPEGERLQGCIVIPRSAVLNVTAWTGREVGRDDALLETVGGNEP